MQQKRINRSQTSGAFVNTLAEFNARVLADQDLAYTLAYYLSDSEELASEIVQTAILQVYQQSTFKPEPGSLSTPRQILSILRCILTICRTKHTHNTSTVFSFRRRLLSKPIHSRSEDAAVAGLFEQLCIKNKPPLTETEYFTELLIDVLGLNYAEAAEVIACNLNEVTRLAASARRKLCPSQNQAGQPSQPVW